MYKNCRFITACKTNQWVTHIKQQNYFITSRVVDIISTAYYIHDPGGDEIFFCCFICVTHRWVLQAVIKRQFLYIYICSFSTSICPWDINTTGFEKRTHWNSTSSIPFGLVNTLILSNLFEQKLCECVCFAFTYQVEAMFQNMSSFELGDVTFI